MKIECTKGISHLKPLTSINNDTKAYRLIVPYHITVKISFDETHHDIQYIEGFGVRIKVGELVNGFEEIGLIERINDIGDNNFIISVKQ